MLNDRDTIIGHFGEMAKESIFGDVLLHKRTFMRNECRDF